MLLLFRMAARNLLRNFRRSAITLASISIGLAFILWLSAILNGMNQTLIASITKAQVGHLQIARSDYRKVKLMHQTFSFDQATIESKLGADAIWAPRAYLPAMISTGESSIPVVLNGINTARELKTSRAAETVKKGSFIDSVPDPDCQKREILISQTMADLLGAELDSKIVVLAQAADGTLGNELLRVKGIYESGSPDFDRGIAYSSMECVQKIGALNGYHEIVILLPNDDHTQELRSQIQPLFPNEIEVTTWDESMPRMANTIKLNHGFLGLIMGILFLVITLGIANTLLVSVFERTREFGLMAALGTRPSQTLSVILIETALIAIGSAIVGCVLALIAIAYYKQTGFDITPFTGPGAQVGMFRVERHIYPLIAWKDNIRHLALMCLFVLTAGVFPAIRSVRMKPTEAMRSL